tara:strand:- start:92 stop:307 length:216 start_codon:yes stop_codon:yes gene_type:complete
MVEHKQLTNDLGLNSSELLLDGKFLLLPRGRKAAVLRILFQTKNSVAIELFVENNLAFALEGFFHFIWACG